MHHRLTYRLVAMALSVVVTLALFETIGHHAAEDHHRLLLVRTLADPALPT